MTVVTKPHPRAQEPRSRSTRPNPPHTPFLVSRPSPPPAMAYPMPPGYPHMPLGMHPGYAPLPPPPPPGHYHHMPPMPRQDATGVSSLGNMPPDCGGVSMIIGGPPGSVPHSHHMIRTGSDESGHTTTTMGSSSTSSSSSTTSSQQARKRMRLTSEERLQRR